MKQNLNIFARMTVAILLLLSVNLCVNADTLRKGGSIVGKIESNGDVRISGSIVGKIERNGDVRKSGSIIGKAEQMSDPRRVAVMYFFDFFKL